MAGSILKSLKRYYRKGVLEACYHCSSSDKFYSISFSGDSPTFNINVTRDSATFEEIDEYGVTFLSMVYNPSPREEDRFKSEIFYRYCDLLKRKFDGKSDFRCFFDLDGKDCDFFYDVIYRLYFHLENDFIYPFLSHLLKVKYHVVSCNPTILRTSRIYLESGGEFVYDDRFSFRNDEIEFTIDCKKPEESIRKAIRFIMRML